MLVFLPPRTGLPMTTLALAASLLLAGPMTADTTAADREISIFISADLEGVTGAVTPEQLGPAGFEYQRFRELMTEEVLAAIDGARQAGATRFLVADSHGNGQNLLIERFPDDVEIVRSWPRPLHMMEGIDETFDAAVFIGYHAAATNPEGVRAHTFSSANLAEVRLNGSPVSEGAVNAAIAGHFGVPVIAVSGDDVTVREMVDLLGDVEGAVVKRALGFHSARTLTPAAGQREIREAVWRGVERLGDFRPHRLEGPITLEVMFKNYRPAEVLSYLPIVDRAGARSIRYTAHDMVEISRFLQFMLNYEAGLSP
jgi:D-amino peptidase